VADALAAAQHRRRYGSGGLPINRADASGAAPALCSWPMLWRTCLACSAPALLLLLFYLALYLKAAGGG
jgi:hypothetical protein